MFRLDTPFESVQQVILIGGTVCAFMSKFGLCFPNAKTLQLYHPRWCKSQKLNMLQNCCPALREVIIEDGNKSTEFTV